MNGGYKKLPQRIEDENSNAVLDAEASPGLPLEESKDQAEEKGKWCELWDSAARVMSPGALMTYLTMVMFGLTARGLVEESGWVKAWSERNESSVILEYERMFLNKKSQALADELRGKVVGSVVESLLALRSVKSVYERELVFAAESGGKKIPNLDVLGPLRETEALGWETLVRTEPIEVKNFGTKHGYNGDEVRAVIAETTPRGMARLVKHVEYVDRQPEVSSSYGLPKGSLILAEAYCVSGRIRVFNPGEMSEYFYAFADHIMPHEEAHLANWLGNSLLTADERLELLGSVIQRLESPDRYKSGYVESIRNSDKKLEMCLKAGEYFSEIVAKFLSPHRYLLPRADRKLVEEYVKKIDPGFNFSTAMTRRKQVQDQAWDRKYSMSTKDKKFRQPSGQSKQSSSVHGQPHKRGGQNKI